MTAQPLPPPSDPDFGDEDEPPSTSDLQDDAPRTTDSANADAVVREHGKGYLFVTEWQAWIAWDGKRWEMPGARGRVLNACMLTARLEHYRCSQRIHELEEKARVLALTGAKDEDVERLIKYLKGLLKWHEQSQNMSRMEACTRALETRLTITLKELDANPWLLNVQNGTIDLRTAELRSHSQSDLITQIADVEWDDNARCPTWSSFVEQSMDRDLALQMYLQRLIGYALTGLTTEHTLAFFHGEGSNGKSTFVQTVRALLGEYACAAPRDLLFEDRNGQRHPSELARLYGKRMVVCAEIGEHVTLDEAKVKDLTGGDTVSVRRMREDFWDLEPSHKLFISGNHKPTVRGDDHGIWRRIRLVPWLVKVSGAQVDKDLPMKLRREFSGILRWAVHGCIEWQENGLAEPASVMDATKDYRNESDAFGDFAGKYLLFEESARMSRQSLRSKYVEWCEELGHRPLGPKKIARRLHEKGVRGMAVREGVRTKDGWAGVRLRTELEMIVTAEPDTNNPTS